MTYKKETLEEHARIYIYFMQKMTMNDKSKLIKLVELERQLTLQELNEE